MDVHGRSDYSFGNFSVHHKKLTSASSVPSAVERLDKQMAVRY